MGIQASHQTIWLPTWSSETIIYLITVGGPVSAVGSGEASHQWGPGFDPGCRQMTEYGVIRPIGLVGFLWALRFPPTLKLLQNWWQGYSGDWSQRCWAVVSKAFPYPQAQHHADLPKGKRKKNYICNLFFACVGLLVVTCLVKIYVNISKIYVKVLVLVSLPILQSSS